MPQFDTAAWQQAVLLYLGWLHAMLEEVRQVYNEVEKPDRILGAALDANDRRNIADGLDAVSGALDECRVYPTWLTTARLVAELRGLDARDDG